MTALVAIIIVGIGTYFSRAVFIIALADRELPESLLSALQYVAPAVLSALIVALSIDSEGDVSIGIPEVAAFAAGGAVAFKTKNHILTLLIGMGVYWLVRSVV